jgi:hypothetical protein
MDASLPQVIVEFFGIPRRKAARATVCVTAGTVAQALQAVQCVCPQLTDLLEADGRLSRHYLASVDGREFVTDLQYAFRAGERLLILSADAGG